MRFLSERNVWQLQQFSMKQPKTRKLSQDRSWKGENSAEALSNRFWKGVHLLHRRESVECSSCDSNTRLRKINIVDGWLLIASPLMLMWLSVRCVAEVSHVSQRSKEQTTLSNYRCGESVISIWLSKSIIELSPLFPNSKQEMAAQPPF